MQSGVIGGKKLKIYFWGFSTVFWGFEVLASRSAGPVGRVVGVDTEWETAEAVSAAWGGETSPC
jgi:hypothetical protein